MNTAQKQAHERLLKVLPVRQHTKAYEEEMQRKRAKRLTKEKQDEVKRLKELGMTNEAVGEELDIFPSAVSRILNR